MKHVAAFLLFGISLWWLWQLITGEWSRYEWIWGAGAAIIAAAIAELAASRTGAHVSFPWEIVKSVPLALAVVFVDFGRIMWALAARREGVFRTTTFPHPDNERFRTWATIVGDYSPNAYIVDISDGKTLTHHMLPRKQSQEPA